MSLDECRDRLKGILKALEDSIDADRTNRTSSEGKRQEFIRTVNNGIIEKIRKDNLPACFCNDIENKYAIRIADHQIDRDFFSENPLIGYVGFPEAYTALIFRNICLRYANQIKLNSSRKKYYIDYFEIREALKALCLSEKYSIISLGIELTDEVQLNIPKDNVHTIRTQYSEILILPKKECPSLTLLENPAIIDIDSIPDSDQDNIKAKVPFIYNQRNFIHYIVLKVIFRDYEGVPSQLSEIVPIHNFI